MKTLLGTLLLVAGACLLGAGISASAATFGLTKFADDRRGEWAFLIVPVDLVLGSLLGYFGRRFLVGASGYTRRQIGGAFAFLVVASCVLLTWRFSKGS